MSRVRSGSVALLVLAIAAGTAADRPRASAPVTLGGYLVLSADFHTHSSMWSDGALTPWGLVLEARRQGLDAIAITGHNEVFDGKLGRWFARLMGGPIILVGQEVVAPGHHLIAVGIDHVVDSRQNLAAQIDDVHRQGGVAIAAHPFRNFWSGFDTDAKRRLDGTEVCHPVIFIRDWTAAELADFAAVTPAAAIGSSDFHGLGRMGACRTYVFASDRSARAILDAVRARRTVVYGSDGRVFGDPAMIQLAAGESRLRDEATTDPPAGWLDWVSRIAGALGLLGLTMRPTAASGAGREAR